MSNHSDTSANPGNSASGKHETNDSETTKEFDRSEANGFDAEDTRTDPTTLTDADDA